MGYFGAGRKLIHEKTRSKKSRDTVPFSTDLPLCTKHILFIRQLLVKVEPANGMNGIVDVTRPSHVSLISPSHMP
jgi:hypothetical protein